MSAGGVPIIIARCACIISSSHVQCPLRVVGLVGNKMSLLLLGLVLSLASAQSSVVNSCSGRGSCQRHLRPLAPSDSTGDTSEDRVLGRLLCHLECLDSVRDQVSIRIARSEIFNSYIMMTRQYCTDVHTSDPFAWKCSIHEQW